MCGAWGVVHGAQHKLVPKGCAQVSRGSHHYILAIPICMASQSTANNAELCQSEKHPFLILSRANSCPSSLVLDAVAIVTVGLLVLLVD